MARREFVASLAPPPPPFFMGAALRSIFFSLLLPLIYLLRFCIIILTVMCISVNV